MSKLAIKVEHVSKEYRLGAIGGTTLRDDLQRFRAKLLHRDDPTTILGVSDNQPYNERFLALDDVSFSVTEGEALGIIGHNGAGKSTLLKLLSRVTAPSMGTISYNGRIASMLEVGTGFHQELTGRENIYMNGAILGMTKAEIDRKFDQIVAFSEMERFIDTPVKRYSSGMYVKLAFAVAAHLDSEILVMDEVLAVGDMKFQQKCLGRMGNAANTEGRTVLYVSHNMSTIRQLCTRCLVLDHGKLIYDGTPEKAIEIYANNSERPCTKYDYSQMKHSMGESLCIQMLGLSVENKTENSIVSGEPLFFTLHCICNRDTAAVKFRFEVFSGEDMLLGAMFSNRSISAKRGQHLDIHLSMDTFNLTPGKYRFRAVASEYNEFGTLQTVSRANPAMILMVEQAKNGTSWNQKSWGGVRFNDMHIQDITIENA